MTYQFDSELFSGPLEVLWQMIQDEKLDINQVSLATLTDEYLIYIQENEEKLSSDELSEFLKVATLLLKMKIRYITKSWQKWEEEDDFDQDNLLWQLKLYGIYHKQELALSKKYDFNTWKMFAKRKSKVLKIINEEAKILNLSRPLIEATAFELMGEWRDRFKKWKISQFKILDVKAKILELNARLNQIAKMSFAELRANLPKAEIIANFLAILELIKRQELVVEQGKNFADLIIEKK